MEEAVSDNDNFARTPLEGRLVGRVLYPYPYLGSLSFHPVDNSKLVVSPHPLEIRARNTERANRPAFDGWDLVETNRNSVTCTQSYAGASEVLPYSILHNPAIPSLVASAWHVSAGTTTRQGEATATPVTSASRNRRVDIWRNDRTIDVGVETGGGGGISLWDTTGGAEKSQGSFLETEMGLEVALPFHGTRDIGYAPTSNLSWHPDGTKLAWGSRGGKVTVWNILSLRIIASVPVGPIRRRRNDSMVVASVDYHPLDGSKIVTGIYQSTRVRLWDTHTWECLACLEAPYDDEYYMACAHARFSPDGERIACIYPCSELGGLIRVYCLDKDNKVTSTLDMGQLEWSPWEAMAWCPNGIHLATLSRDRGLYLWDATRGGPSLVEMPTEQSFCVGVSLAWSADGSYIVTSSGDVFQITIGSDESTQETQRPATLGEIAEQEGQG